MAITNGYATLVEIKSAGVLNITDSDWDTPLEYAIEAASRWIDQELDTRFYTASEIRYYTANFPDWVVIDDLVSITTLKTDDDDDGVYEVTWTSGDYYLAPKNASLNGRPYRDIKIKAYGDYTFPSNPNGVEVVGAFGYSASEPKPIKELCLLMAVRVFKRIKDKPFGISGVADLGTLEVVSAIGKDDEMQKLLKSVSRRVI